MSWIPDESGSVTVAYLARAFAHIVSISAPSQAHAGEVVSVVVDIQNTGDDRSDLRAIFTDTWSGAVDTHDLGSVGIGGHALATHYFTMPARNATVNIAAQHFE